LFSQQAKNLSSFSTFILPNMPTTRSKSSKEAKDSDQVGDKREHKGAEVQDDKPDTKSVKVESNQKAGGRRHSTSKKSKENEQPDSKKTSPLEKGHIYFFYRPKVGHISFLIFTLNQYGIHIRYIAG
jgi:hypothetical protein